MNPFNAQFDCRLWLRRWLFVLNVGLVLAALAVGALLARRALFFAVVVPLAFVPFAYARLRLHDQLVLALRGHGALALTVTGIALDALMAAQLLTARAADGAPLLHGAVVDWAGPVWFSAHALAFLGYAGIGLVRAAARLLRQLRLRRAPAPAVETGAPLVGRREALRQFAVVGAAAPFALSLSGVPLSYDFRVEERELELPGWPRALDGLRVAHLSDIHVGGAMNRERLRRIVELTNAARPDLVLHTGDFLTHRGGDFDAPLYDALARLAAPYGQFACLGNHDLDDPERLVRRLHDAGVATLRGALTTIAAAGQPLQIAGIDFAFERGARAAHYGRVAGAWRPRDGTPRLLLNHDPSGFAALPDGCADLVLSGHTHGGHIGIQLGRDHALTVVGLAGLPDQGLFRRGAMRMFVTRCVGFYGYPMRVGIPPEIALLVLRSPRPGRA